IDQHRLREDRGFVRVSGPVSSHGDVEDHEKGMVIYPLRSLWKVRWGTSFVEVVVDVEANCSWLPFDREDVEVIRKSQISGQAVRISDAVCARISWPVNGTVYNRWLFANVFHNVDLAEIGPTGFVNVVAQHPEGGPDSLATRNFDAGFEASIG